MKKVIVLVVVLSGCASAIRERAVVDGTTSKPDWVGTTKTSWLEGDQVFFRNQYTVRGDERLNGCFQLVRLESKEALLREISEDLRGEINSAQEGLSESSELALTQVRSGEFSGKVTGMRFTEQFSERYVVNGVERIDCFVLAAIKKSDYDQIKRQVLFKVAATDPGLKKAMNDRAVKFFTDEKTDEKMGQE